MAYSGATYPKVPATPVVACVSELPSSLASPKSERYALSSLSSRMLLGFTSLWRILGEQSSWR
ncbi:unnamed protein product [Spirodela intermedia]|uniref:Uncharacterized protein n=2 Tax=Spirodela intermedia TaxID=51605 RepID=A0A7I8IHW1_SPIIN|nr:unnamed protein product [Spirodela intermedia]CAA6657374.1 unnamed protein product [Spirodela intermedia]CAA7393428.1 unnamed protein product [Spirodela intermedia]